eukprot:15473088-Alexandrium_andersonii.AAC.1
MAMPTDVRHAMAAFFCQVLDGTERDHGWGEVLVSLIAKTPAARQVNGYRPIALINTLEKIYEKALGKLTSQALGW